MQQYKILKLSLPPCDINTISLKAERNNYIAAGSSVWMISTDIVFI